MSRVNGGLVHLHYIIERQSLDRLYTIGYYYNMDKKYKLERLDEGKLYSFKIEQELLDWLRKEAGQQKISVSQLIRDSINLNKRFTKAS